MARAFHRACSRVAPPVGSETTKENLFELWNERCGHAVVFNMNLTSSHPFWSVNNGLPANYPSLQRDVSCDAVVIGGGITGSLVAVHLAEAGVKTLLIDKRDIGTGSTSASTALIQYEIDVPLRKLVQYIGPLAATRSYQLCL